MGSCTSIDKTDEDSDNYYPKVRKDQEVTINELTHNTSMEDFMSRHRMSIHCNTDPLNRSRLLSSIISQFKDEFDRDISKGTLYDYFGV